MIQDLNTYELLVMGFTLNGFFLAGLIYGFFDGVVVGALFAWLYNHLAQRSAEIQAVN